MNINMFLSLLLYASFLFSCSKNSNDGGNNEPPPATTGDTVNAWLTKADATALLQKDIAMPAGV